MTPGNHKMVMHLVLYVYVYVLYVGCVCALVFCGA